MFENFITVFQQVLVLFLLISVGFIFTKFKVFNAEAIKSITTFVLYAVTGCLIVHSFNRPFQKELISTMGITFAVAVFAHVVGIIIARLLIKGTNSSEDIVLKYAVVFSNAGFMALPLQYAILDTKGVLFGAIYISVFNIFSWTYGVYLMNNGMSKSSLKKAILNPGTIGTVIGIVLFFTPVSLPTIMDQAMEKIAVMNTSLPMIIIGYFLATSKIGLSFEDTKLIFAIVLRLIITPLAVFGFIYLMGLRGTILIVTMIATSTPSAANTVMFAELFDQDVELATKIVSITTVLSVFTIPPIISLVMYLS